LAANSHWRQRVGPALGFLAGCLPGRGEEIVCVAVKPEDGAPA